MRLLGLIFFAFFGMLAGVGSALPAQDAPWFGAAVETVTPEMKAEKGLMLPFGARVTSVEPGSPASQAGLAEGDVIFSVNDGPVADAAALNAAIGNLAVGASVSLNRMRGNEPATLSVTLIERPVSSEPVPLGEPPHLMLDTGGHMAIINDITFTPGGKFVVSAADDKVVRVWDWRTGTTVRTIRGESGAGSNGKIFAMALSPDGRRLAIGGWMATYTDDNAQDVSTIRLFDFTSGQLLHLLKGHDSVVLSLAFSPDGRRLVSGSGDSTAIVWDIPSEPERAPKLLHRLAGHSDDIYGLAFSNDGRRVVTGSYDHTVRLWRLPDDDSDADRVSGILLEGHNDKVYRVAVSPKDGTIASASQDGIIALWDSQTGEFLKVLTSQSNKVGALAFNPDGSKLLASSAEGTGGTNCYVYDVATGDVLVTYTGHNNIVIAATISPDGRYAVTGGGDNHEIHIWELETGTRVKGPDGTPVALTGTGAPGWATGFSADGRRIAWGNTSSYVNPNARGPLEFQLDLPLDGGALAAPSVVVAGKANTAASVVPDGAPDFVRASRTFEPYTLRHRAGGNYEQSDAILEVVRGDTVIARLGRGGTDGYGHNAYTFTPDGKTIVSAGDQGHLHAYDVAKVIAAAKDAENQLLWGDALKAVTHRFIGHEADVFAVTPSPDGKFLVSGAVDQTVRLWNLETQELVVTLFHGTDGEWAMWTPQGFYTGSPGGGKLVGWQINKGADKEAQYVRGRQLREKLHRPDIVERAIQLASAEAAIKAAGLDTVSLEAMLTKLPPVITAESGTVASGGAANVLVESEPNEDAPIKTVLMTVSDGVQETTVEPKLLPLVGAPPPKKGAIRRLYEVPLFKGKNTVRVVAINAAGESEPVEFKITHNGEGRLDKRGTLWVLAVGVEKYPDTSDAIYKDLTYAGDDAQAFAKTAVAQMGRGHKKTDVTVLINDGGDGEPTRENILEALARIQNGSDPNGTDTIVILLSGHGENWEGGRYHFLPTDLKRTNEFELGENVLDWRTDIHPAIAGAKGRKILFLDACNSGNAYNKSLLSDADADRFVAFSAAGPNQVAWELKDKGHGAFTHTLMEALKGARGAIDPSQKAVTIYRLGNFLSEVVATRTNRSQTPEFRSGQGNFVLTRQ